MTTRAVAGALAAVLVVLALAQLEWRGDRDHDGVADGVDRCPATPSGQAIDAEGCSAAEHAFRRGLDALTGAEALLNVGTAWVVGRLLGVHPDPRLRALIERSVPRLAQDPSVRLIDRAVPLVDLPEDPGRGLMRFVSYLKAPIGRPPSRAVEYLAALLSTDESGYVLTHQLLVLPWADDQGLDLPESLRARQDHLLERILAEQRAAEQFNDLYAERAALLLAFGSPPPGEAADWIETIVRAQQPDGRWVDNGRSIITYDGQTAPAVHEWTHTTGFCLTALGFSLEGSPM